MREQWKVIEGFEPYEVSTLGRVRSKFHTGGEEYRILKPSIHHSGYILYRLAKNKKYYNRTVHILVAKAFIDNPFKKTQVNHIDGNKQNNSVDNLEWVTPSENIQHAFKLNLKTSPNKNKKGIEHYASKPVLQYDLKGNLVKKWDCYSDASRYHHISVSAICNCCANRIKSAGGFIWRYYNGEPIRQKIVIERNRKSRKIIHQYTLSGDLVKSWDGYKDIEEHSDYNRKLINACCHGKSKSSYGFKWVCEYI